MATTMETATSGALIAQGGLQSRQFQGLFNIIPFTFSFEENTIGAQDSSTLDITVAGARLGDFVLIGTTIDMVSIQMSGWVRANNSVTIVAQNLETSDSNTTLATVATHNGLLLRPNQNVLKWAS